MSEGNTVRNSHDAQSGHYTIRIRGHLDARWLEWFEGLTLAHTVSGETILTGSIVDQAALHGVLGKIRDLGLPLLSVEVLSQDDRLDRIEKPNEE